MMYLICDPLLRVRKKHRDTKTQRHKGGRSNRGTDIEIRLLISLSVPESSSIAPAPFVPLCLCVSVFFFPFESSSTPPDERHLRRHHGHKLHVGFERKICHVKYRVANVLQIHTRLNGNRSVRLRSTGRHSLGHFSCRVSDIDLSASDIVLSPIERYTFCQPRNR